MPQSSNTDCLSSQENFCLFPTLNDAYRGANDSYSTRPIQPVSPTELLKFCQNIDTQPVQLVQAGWLVVLYKYTACEWLVFGMADELPQENDNRVARCSVQVSPGDIPLALIQDGKLQKSERLNVGDYQLNFFNSVITKNAQNPLQLNAKATLNIDFNDEIASISFGFWSSILSCEQAATLAGALEQAIVHIMENPSTKISDLNICTQENRSLLFQWNHLVPLAEESTIHNLIQRQCETRPDAIAICSWDGNLTYRELDRAANQLALILRIRGVKPETFVPLYFEKSKWTVVAMLGVMKAGGAFVLLDSALPLQRLQTMCNQVGATMILCSEHLTEKAGSLCCITIPVGNDLWNWAVAYAKGNNENGTEETAVNPQNALYGAFTSGSTGMPKCAVISHRSYASSAKGHIEPYHLGPSSRVFQFASYSFDASISETLDTLISGGCLCIPSAMETRNYLASTMRHFNANWVFLTPTVARLLNQESLPSLKTIVLGGEAVTKYDIHQWSAGETRLMIAYGPSECSACTAVLSQVEGPQDANLIGYGTGAVCWITDSSDPGRLQPIGAPGELLIEGPIVGRGYLNDAEKTEAAFIDPPSWLLTLRGGSHGKLYRTGDLVQYTNSQRIRYLGRKDDQVKVNGQRLELEEVQHAVQEAFNSAAEKVVVDIITPADIRSRPTLVAFVLLQNSSTNSGSFDDADVFARPSAEFRQLAELAIAILRKRLPRYMIPSILVPLAILPLTASGKTNQRLLRARACALSRQELGFFMLSEPGKLVPSTEIEQALYELTKEVLVLEKFGMEDNFFHLGGDSISAMKLVSRARDEGLRLQTEDIFTAPRLADLAQSIEVFSAEQAQLEVFSPFTLLPGSMTMESAIRQAQTQCDVLVDEIEDIYPCTPAQEGMMAITAKNDKMYISQAVFQLPVDLDIPRFKAAWEETIASNPILRTRIITTEQGLLQVVIRKSITWGDPTAIDEDGSRGPFGLGRPLIQLTLDGRQSRLSIFMHHAMYDGWSLPLVLGQVENAYLGHALSYKPFTSFINYLVQSSRSDMEGFWQTYLKDLVMAPFPALGGSSQKTKDTQATMVKSIALGGTISKGITLATVLHLAWAMTVSQYTNSQDVLMGVVSSGRNIPVEGVDRIVGPLITIMPSRVAVDATKTIEEMCLQIQQQTVRSFPFEHIGLQHLSKLGEDCASAAKFRNLLVIQPQKDPLPGIFGKLTQGGFNVTLDSFDFVLECHLSKGAVDISANYNPGLLSQDQANRVLNQYASVLTHIQVAPPHEPISGGLSTVSPTDLTQLHSWNEEVPQTVEMCVHDLIEQHIVAQPDRPAVAAWDGDLSYRELGQLSDIFALRLAEYRVGPEDFVPLYFEKSKWTAVAMLGVMKSGAAFVLLDPSHPLERTGAICCQLKVSVLVSSFHNQPILKGLSGLKVITMWDSEADMKVPTATVASPKSPALPSNPVYAVFTSGSTGTPKGTVIEHRSFATNALNGPNSQFLDRKSRVFQFASYAFDASIAEILFTFVSGGCVCVPHEKDRATDVVECANSFGITHLYQTPSMVRTLHPSQFTTLKTLILCGEAMKQDDVLTWAHRVQLVNAYGPSECTIASVQRLNVTAGSEPSNIGTSCSACTWVVDPANHENLLPIGAVGELVVEGPIVGRGYIDEKEKTTAVFVDSPAWLRQIRGQQNHRRVYKTGDLVQYDPIMDGSLLYKGRKDTQVKLRGQRIELGEIENRILQCSANIKDVIVELVTAESKSPALVAFIWGSEWVKTSAQDETQILACSSAEFRALVEEMQATLQDQLPAYMIPSGFLPVRRIPRTSTGKADRNRLCKLAAGLSPEDMLQFWKQISIEKRMPVTEAEKILQDAVATALRLEANQVGLESDFFQIGGNSLTIMRLVHLLRKAGCHELSMTDVYELPVLSKLAGRVDQTRQTS